VATEAPAATPAPPKEPGRISRTVTGVKGRVEAGQQWVEETRPRVPPLDYALTAVERDRDRGGALLAGAIAFRMFLWILPAGLVFVAGLGFASSYGDSAASTVAHNSGMAAIASKSIQQAAEQANHTKWVALVAGLYFLYGASASLLKVVAVTHALAWGVPRPKLKKKYKGVAFMIAVTVVIIALVRLLALARARVPVLGLGLIIVFIAIYAAIWWLVSYFLPHGDAPPHALIPGAILFAVGVQALHVATVYFLARKVTSASSWYGELGGAAVLLAWLYLVGRLIVASAFLNSILWNKRSA
jgi:uncharacterized BrkB/YihY/UPF0761 family membrane protein